MIFKHLFTPTLLTRVLVLSALLTACSSTPQVEPVKPLVLQDSPLNQVDALRETPPEPPTGRQDGKVKVLRPYKFIHPDVRTGYDDEPRHRHEGVKTYTNASIKSLGIGSRVAYAPLHTDPGLSAPGDAPMADGGKRSVLFIGDSHSTALFGATLISLIETQVPGAQVTAVASCGSSPDWWLDGNKATRCGFWRHNADGSEEKGLRGLTPQVDGLIRSVQPQTVIVALGANLIPQHKEDRILQTRALMERVTEANRQCFWIGPPDSRKFSQMQTDDVYVLLEELARDYDCRLIDSRSYTHYPRSGGDGLHYSGKEGESIAKSWAIQVFQDYLQDRLL